MQLADVYFWWDSAAAAERVGRRLLRTKPKSHLPWWILAQAASKTNDSASAHAALRQFNVLAPLEPGPYYDLRVGLMLEDYDAVESTARVILQAPRPAEEYDLSWTRTIALRNQGRMVEALRLARGGQPHAVVPDAGGGDIHEAVMSFENGDARTAASIFQRRMRLDISGWATGIRARHLAWHATLAGMALAALGDTLGLRQMADTAEYWGRRSAYGRDRKSHHYLRGLLLVSRGDDEAAVEQFRQAMHSKTMGFTRVNYDLARALVRLNRFDEAIATLQPALRGDVDGPNLYLTRTDTHELLAQTFDRLARRDSAAAHYRAVVRAWEHADQAFNARRQLAVDWLARFDGAAK